VTALEVSVALCTYNGARYLEEQLQSIVSQSQTVREIVVADDGSTDETLAIVRRVAAAPGVRSQGIEFRILEGGGHGVTKNFERAIAACRFNLIALCDQDDIWTAGRLERQCTEFDSRPGLSLLFGDARLVNEHGSPVGATLFDTLEVDAATRARLHEGAAFEIFLRRNIVTGATVMFRRSLTDTALPIPREWVHDEWLAIMAAAVGEVDLMEFIVTDYRQHGNNQIGVRIPTVRNKVQRVLQPRGSRNRDLAVRSNLLADRLESIVGGSKGAAARRKSGFERQRADLPANRILRLAKVLRLAQTGGYRAFASQGRIDIVRDLLQPI
jgi:glycosyltransferase involved in cell wall biosynthesis